MNFGANLPPKLTYIRHFISESEEKELLANIYDAPASKWTQLSNRRLQNWGGLPHPKGMFPETIPPWLHKYFNRIEETKAFQEVKPNHCLVNEYSAGQGIMPHEDGNLFYPTVSTISLGSHTVLDFYKRITDDQDDATSSSFEDRLIGSVFLEPRSLVLVQEDLYKVYLHGIKEVTCDTITESISNRESTPYKLGDSVERGTRVSLTIRHVPKTINSNKLNAIFGKRRT